MMGLYEFFYEYYYISLILQGGCIFHIVRNKRGFRWIYIVLFLPIIGSVIYIFSEFNNRKERSKIGNPIIPKKVQSLSIRKLEHNLSILDSFENKVDLADAYLQADRIQEAIDLYKDALQGPLANNPYANRKLAQAYFLNENYQQMVDLVQSKVIQSPEFDRTLVHMQYGLALERLDKIQEAEAELSKMNDRYSNFEMRFNLGQFYIRQDKIEKAAIVFEAMINDAKRLSRKEKSGEMQWIRMAKKELDGLQIPV